MEYGETGVATVLFVGEDDNNHNIILINCYDQARAITHASAKNKCAINYGSLLNKHLSSGLFVIDILRKMKTMAGYLENWFNI